MGEKVKPEQTLLKEVVNITLAFMMIKIRESPQVIFLKNDGQRTPLLRSQEPCLPDWKQRAEGPDEFFFKSPARWFCQTISFASTSLHAIWHEILIHSETSAPLGFTKPQQPPPTKWCKQLWTFQRNPIGAPSQDSHSLPSTNLSAQGQSFAWRCTLSI